MCWRVIISIIRIRGCVIIFKFISYYDVMKIRSSWEIYTREYNFSAFS